MVEALHVPYRRVVRSEPADATLKELFDAAMAAAAPSMGSLSKALEPVTTITSTVVADDAGGGDASPTQQLSPEAMATLKQAQEQFPYTIHKGLMCAAYNLEQWEAFGQLAHLAIGRTDAAVVAGGDADPSQSADQLATVSNLLQALRRLSTEPGVGALRQLATAIQQALSRGSPATAATGTGSGVPRKPSAVGMGMSTTAAATATSRAPPATGAPPAAQQQAQLMPRLQLRDLIVDASLALYGSARPLIDGVYCAEDKEAVTVAELLFACHAAWSAVDLDDGELRISVALKLALLLEQDDQLLAAREVLIQVRMRQRE